MTRPNGTHPQTAPRPILAVLLAVLAALFASVAAHAQELSVTLSAPTTILTGVPFEQTVETNIRPDAPLTVRAGQATTELAPDAFSERPDALGFQANAENLVVDTRGDVDLSVSQGGTTLGEATTKAIPGWLSVLPAVLAIFAALLTRQVIPSLFGGVLLGAWFAQGATLPGLWLGLLDTMQVYVLEALVPPDGGKFHMQIVVFTLMMGGMIGIIYRIGGAHAIADRISQIATTRRRGQLGTSGLGFAVFFNDYANSLIVGNTMRPVTDRLRVSREKLAYITDSTAAPLAGIAIISTWIGYQLGLIEDAIGKISHQEGAYSIFLNALPYNFYPIFALSLVMAVGYSRRDFGPMAAAERRAYHEGKLLRDGADVDENATGNDTGELSLKEGAAQRSINFVLPIGVLVATVAIGLFTTGSGDNVREIVGSADSGKILTWAGLLGVLTAALLATGQRILTTKETVGAWYAGMKSVFFVLIILTLAWCLSAIATDLKTAPYLVSILGDSIPPQFLPAILFVLAAAISFAVGTSWGTMGILMPLAIPLVWTLMQNAGVADGDHMYIFYATVGTILAGSVWGDHCSPISDTTIISSVAAGSDHIDHVRTQIPYALTAGGLAIVIGLIPTGFGVPWWITLPLGIAATFGIMYLAGSEIAPDDAQEEADAERAPAE